MKSKQEIFWKQMQQKPDDYSSGVTGGDLLHVIGPAMDEYAKEYAIAFLGWYAIKSIGFIEYLQLVKPQVTSQEIESNLEAFEGKPISELMKLFEQSQTIKE